jgi:hypothetical protein
LVYYSLCPPENFVFGRKIAHMQGARTSETGAYVST